MTNLIEQGFNILQEHVKPSVVTPNNSSSTFFEKHLHENYYIIIELTPKKEHIISLQRRFIGSGSNELIVKL